jgi:2,4-dienoyl-CoA reductase-like NADH-dependent reductase (Old Yellow Enzyme family)/thioredoxin reductase
MPAMLTCYAEGRHVSQRLVDYLEARARGGAGLIIQEFATVDPLGPIVPNQVGVYDDACIPGLEKMAAAIRKHGTRIAIQLGHGGHRAWSRYIGTQPVSASDVPGRGGEKPRPLTLDEIKRLVESFVSAAIRVKKAGFDGVEIHCAHGYLIRQFLSPYTNKRTDQYGGDLANRARLALEVVSSVRQAVGNFPVWARINGDDFVPTGGFTFEESKTVCQWLEKAGVDAISVSGSTYESPVNWGLAPMFVPRGYLLPMAEEIRKIIGVPVIAVGRIDTPEFAERILSEGKTDFVAMGRALIADPDLPVKAKQGKTDDLRRCIADNVCIDTLNPETRMRCTVNPCVGKEGECSITRAQNSKKVVVIGGGPGGMEAARVAALRGHQVTLYERETALGGQINIASKGKNKEDINLVTSFLSMQIKKLGVAVCLGTSVTSAFIVNLKPDVVVVATGADPMIPPVPGVERENVCNARDVLLGKKTVGKRIIIVGGGRVGMETAEFLKNGSNEIVIIEMLARIGNDVGDSFRFASINRLRELGVKMLVNTRLEKIDGAAVTISSNGKARHLDIDYVILATGAKSNQEIFNAIGENVEKHFIGDCKKPRNICEAISEGSEVGRML